MLTMGTNAYWAFCEFMIRQAATVEVATLWNKIFFLWPLLLAFTLHFTLAFTESSLLKNKFVYVLVYFPAIAFSIIDLTTNWISVTPILTFWGYTPVYPVGSIASHLNGIWSAAISLAILFLFVNYYYKIKEKTKRQQTKFMAIGFTIPIAMSIFTDSLFPIANINFPGLGSVSSSLTAIFVAYAIFKYELFSLNPEIAAQNIFSTIPDSIVLVDIDSRIIKVNQSLLELSGYTEEEVVGKSIGEFLQKAMVLNKASETPVIISELRKIRELKNYEITFYHKLGEKKSVTLSCSIVSNNSGQDIGVAFILHDITERKAMEQKLLKAERFASIGELAGIIGHDLRNPLTGIRGATYYLKNKYYATLDSKDKAMFETIDKSIEYSNKIVNDLIEYSSDINLELETTTPEKLINSTLKLITAPSNISLKVEIQETPKLEIDVDKMRRSFIRIIKNAFDAMPNGGELSIKSTKVGNSIFFSFIDTGNGMTQETLERIWSPLFTTKAKGMGFGLAISRRTVEAHGGKITAESSYKKGTTITFELPL